MPLRVRLTLLYIGLLVPALIAFGVVVYIIASRRIYNGVDDTLSVREQSIESALQSLEGPITPFDISRNRPSLDSQAQTGSAYRILDVQGRAVYSSSRLADVELPAPKTPIRDNPKFATIIVQGRRNRIIYDPILGGSGELFGSVEVATALKPTDDALDQIRTVFIGGGIMVLFLTTVPAYLVAGRALDPVRQVSQLARDVEQTADFSKRLPAPKGGGETAQLVATFNAMIDRVERMLVTQRAFLADSSHELRRPLTVLRTYIDILNDPLLPEEEREACYAEMHTEAESMSRLISDLLLLSREGSQAIRKAPVDYTSLCRATVERLRSQDDRHTLVVKTTSDIRVEGDRERLEQMLWNLLENATQYTPEGGKVEIRLLEVDGMARVEVEDTGIGIPPEEQAHVFDRFYRGDSARAARAEGAGLGLAIVKHVAESHGGSVSVLSEPGKGTTFAVEVPATNGHTGF